MFVVLTYKRQTEASGNAQTTPNCGGGRNSIKGVVSAEGITFIEFPHCPKHPYGVQWRVDDKRKTKSFKTREKPTDFAKSLAGDAKRDGLAAFRLDASEAREWRAFRALIGETTGLDAVARHWLQTGAKVSVLVEDCSH